MSEHELAVKMNVIIVHVHSPFAKLTGNWLQKSVESPVKMDLRWLSENKKRTILGFGSRKILLL